LDRSYLFGCNQLANIGQRMTQFAVGFRNGLGRFALFTTGTNCQQKATQQD
jgi:hypothetical protein